MFPLPLVLTSIFALWVYYYGLSSTALSEPVSYGLSIVVSVFVAVANVIVTELTRARHSARLILNEAYSNYFVSGDRCWSFLEPIDLNFWLHPSSSSSDNGLGCPCSLDGSASDNHACAVNSNVHAPYPLVFWLSEMYYPASYGPYDVCPAWSPFDNHSVGATSSACPASWKPINMFGIAYTALKNVRIAIEQSVKAILSLCHVPTWLSRTFDVIVSSCNPYKLIACVLSPQLLVSIFILNAFAHAPVAINPEDHPRPRSNNAPRLWQTFGCTYPPRRDSYVMQEPQNVSGYDEEQQESKAESSAQKDEIKAFVDHLFSLQFPVPRPRHYDIPRYPVTEVFRDEPPPPPPKPTSMFALVALNPPTSFPPARRVKYVYVESTTPRRMQFPDDGQSEFLALRMKAREESERLQQEESSRKSQAQLNKNAESSCRDLVLWSAQGLNFQTHSSSPEPQQAAGSASEAIADSPSSSGTSPLSTMSVSTLAPVSLAPTVVDAKDEHQTSTPAFDNILDVHAQSQVVDKLSLPCTSPVISASLDPAAPESPAPASSEPLTCLPPHHVSAEIVDSPDNQNDTAVDLSALDAVSEVTSTARDDASSESRDESDRGGKRRRLVVDSIEDVPCDETPALVPVSDNADTSPQEATEEGPGDLALGPMYPAAPCVENGLVAEPLAIPFGLDNSFSLNTDAANYAPGDGVFDDSNLVAFLQSSTGDFQMDDFEQSAFNQDIASGLFQDTAGQPDPLESLLHNAHDAATGYLLQPEFPVPDVFPAASLFAITEPAGQMSPYLSSNIESSMPQEEWPQSSENFGVSDLPDIIVTDDFSPTPAIDPSQFQMDLSGMGYDDASSATDMDFASYTTSNLGAEWQHLMQVAGQDSYGSDMRLDQASLATYNPVDWSMGSDDVDGSHELQVTGWDPVSGMITSEEEVLLHQAFGPLSLDLEDVAMSFEEFSTNNVQPSGQDLTSGVWNLDLGNPFMLEATYPVPDGSHQPETGAIVQSFSTGAPTDQGNGANTENGSCDRSADLLAEILAFPLSRISLKEPDERSHVQPVISSEVYYDKSVLDMWSETAMEQVEASVLHAQSSHLAGDGHDDASSARYETLAENPAATSDNATPQVEVSAMTSTFSTEAQDVVGPAQNRERTPTQSEVKASSTASPMHYVPGPSQSHPVASRTSQDGHEQPSGPASVIDLPHPTGNLDLLARAADSPWRLRSRSEEGKDGPEDVDDNFHVVHEAVSPQQRL
ncbi:hypothetical protein CERSUDRAFT_98205 [Gelatoporia subvermispora B]|uniref:Transmembrane protein n=1 Tax=Ceriporiopsis subvermispora (strain B) TaxID=914234 RepID=M2R664_CERS8|nr:hypothetical protein CERSUDRAFT_98205 [Gelatoporia subvermispora B]